MQGSFRWWGVVFAIICFSSVFAIYNYSFLLVQYRAVLGEVGVLQENNSILDRGVKVSFDNIGNVFPNVLLEDTLGNKVCFNKLIRKTGTLFIVRTSERFCNSCVRSSIEKVLKFAPLEKMSNIIFIMDCDKMRVLNYLVDVYGIRGFDVYNVGLFDFPAEYYNMPYYMVVDSSCIVKRVWIPTNFYNAVDSSYIDYMCKYLN